jgi:hypothetical protein
MFCPLSRVTSAARMITGAMLMLHNNEALSEDEHKKLQETINKESECVKKNCGMFNLCTGNRTNK